MRTDISLASNLAVRTLQILAGQPVAWRPEFLAARIPMTVTFTNEVLEAFQGHGWVEQTPDGYRYTSPPVPPSLLDVIQAIEGVTRPDACVLRENTTCGSISGEPFCNLHDGWLRARYALLEQLAATSAI